MKRKIWGTSLVVLWLKLYMPGARGTSSIPGGWAKIPRAAQYSQKKKKEKYCKS